MNGVPIRFRFGGDVVAGLHPLYDMIKLHLDYLKINLLSILTTNGEIIIAETNNTKTMLLD
jgi:hypothetical protein